MSWRPGKLNSAGPRFFFFEAARRSYFGGCQIRVRPGLPWGHTANMQALALWALAGLLPVSGGDDSRNFARSLRRRFALVGALFGLGLVAFVWDWTANIVVTCVASVVILAGLFYYSEHAHRPAI